MEIGRVMNAIGFDDRLTLFTEVASMITYGILATQFVLSETLMTKYVVDRFWKKNRRH